MNMNKIYFTELLDKQFEPFLVDISLHGSEYDYAKTPKIRRLMKVELRKEKSATWLYWHWAPGQDVCNYSGVLVRRADGTESVMHKLDKLYLNKFAESEKAQ